MVGTMVDYLVDQWESLTVVERAVCLVEHLVDGMVVETVAM